MAKKRPKIEEDLFAPTTGQDQEEVEEEAPAGDETQRQEAPAGKEEAEEKQPAKRKTPASRLAKRATYDISAELKEAIAERATRLGIPASQLAHFLLLDAWQRLEQGEIDPTPYLVPSDSPAFRNRLEIDDLYEE